MKKRLLPLVIAFFFSVSLAMAQSPFTAQAVPDSYQGQDAVRVTFDFPAEHHLYSSFAVTDSEGTPLQTLFIPEPDTNKPEDLEPSYSAGFDAFYTQPGQGDAITVSFQGCAGSLCYMPQEETFQLDKRTAVESAAVAKEGAQPVADLLAARGEPRRAVGFQDTDEFLVFLDPDTPPAEKLSAWRLFLEDPAEFYLSHGVLPSILLILIGGFLLNLTPCVLPMIPINLAIIGASGTDASRGARFGLGLVYGLGMALVYGALGLVVVLTGSVFGSINSSPVFNGAIALLFFGLALAMFDVWQLDFSRFRKTSAIGSRARLPAVLVLGGISALLAGACVAPVLIAVLALSGSLYAKGVTSALFLPFLLGIGMALPWPLAAAGLAILPKPGAWMEKVKKVFGVLILLLALYYGWNAVQALRSPAAAPESDSNAASVFHEIDLGHDTPETFEALLKEGLASGKPILFDFGAHWCKVCKLMQATTLQDAQVVEQLREMFPIHIIADEPNKPPAKELLTPFAIQGYPTYLLYPAAASPAP